MLFVMLIAATPLVDWPRMRSDVFGCMLEREYKHKDPRFNCALTGYENKGSPCGRGAEAYYEGPAAPPGLLEGAEHLTLAWEGGTLRAVTIELAGQLSAAQARKRLELPDKLPANAAGLDVQSCGTGKTCVSLEGFEHVGAGDVDCPPEAVSLCKASETIVFSCERDEGKTAKYISLCQADNELHYRFGAPGNVELDHPKTGKSAAKSFWFSPGTLRFENAKTAYEINIEDGNARLLVYLPKQKPMPIACKPGFTGGLPDTLKALIPRPVP